jgi:ABC-type antimicrobial peptide transport system permease subunit
MNIERMKRTSHFFSVASLLITIALLIAIVAVVAAGIAVAFNSDLMNDLLTESGGNIIKNDVYLVVAIAGICLPLVAMMFFLAHRLFRNIGRSHTPFTMDNVKILKWISYLILILAIPASIIIALLTQRFSSWTEDAVVGWSGVPLVLLAVMFYFMAHVFEYGTALQKESDETL